MKRFKKLIVQNKVQIFLVILLLSLYLVLYKLYIPRINAFGCFDDCNNFMGGYYLLQGKQIFSDFFFNHQPFAAHLSALIQLVSSPENLYELILRHRQFVLLFSFLFNIALILRFKFVTFLFIPFFELSKFYLFGDRFLAEGIIVYPLIYITGTLFLKLSNNKLLTLDYLLAPVFVWFVIFMREPYVPLAIVVFVALLVSKKLTKIHYVSAGTFLILCAATLLQLNISDFIFNVITINYQTVLPSDINVDMFGNRFIQAFFYPLYIFFYGKLNNIHILLILLNIVFLANIIYLVKSKRKIIAIAPFLILGLANLRVVLPGAVFYEAFHMLVWFGLFIFTTCYLVYLNNKYKLLFKASILILIFSLISFVGSKSYFAHESQDPHRDLLTNYGEVMQIGNVINSISSKNDTLFIDGSDDIIYWISKIDSPYKYSWYTSAMPHFKIYTDARTEMFKNNPPTFYKEYGSCPKKSDIGENYRLPDFVKDKYVRLNTLENPSCLFVLKQKVDKITSKQWRKANEFLYNLPK